MLTGRIERRIFKDIAAQVIQYISTMFHAGSEHEAARALLAGEADRLPDSKLGAMTRWALVTRSRDFSTLSD